MVRSKAVRSCRDVLKSLVSITGGPFAPVCRLQSIIMMVAITAEQDYKIYMVDVQTAFLDADVEEDVFVKMLPGYERSNKAALSGGT